MSTEKESLQNTLLPQAMNSSPPTLTAASTTTTPLVVPSSISTLPKTRGQDPTLTESTRAEEASEAFREHRADLLIAVTDPLILANSLYAKRIISRETLDHVMFKAHTPAEKNMPIFDAVEARIKTNPSDFSTVLDILSGNPQLHIFARCLQQSYGEFSIECEHYR